MIKDTKKKDQIPPNEEPATTGFRPTESLDGAAQANSLAVTYQVSVHTGDVPSAGTDGDVWVWVDGTMGRTGWLYLDNDDDNFEKNKTDYFYFTLPNIGNPIRAWIYFVPLGGNSEWFLNTVIFNGKLFSSYRWFTHKGMVQLNPA